MNRKLLLSNIAVLVLFAIGVSYVSLYLARYNPTKQPYQVRVELPHTGGLYFNSDVTYLGKPVGDVKQIRPRPGGVAITVAIDPDVHIPRDTAAVVSGLSPVGEQYLDFRPRSDGSPYLADGDVVVEADTKTPVQFATMMRHVATLAEQIDPAPIRTVVDELATAFGDPETDMQRIVVDAETLLSALEETQPEAARLLRNGQVVLDTATDLRQELLTFAHDAQVLTRAVRDGRPVYRKALSQVPGDLDRLSTAVESLRGPIADLLDELLPVLDVLGARGPAITTLLEQTPVTGRLISSVFYDGWANALADVKVSSPVCTYGATQLPAPWIAQRPDIDYSKTCTEYGPNLQQRGSYFAPRP